MENRARPRVFSARFASRPNLLERDVEHAYQLAVYELMMRDGLTQLYNDRKFEEESEREFARAERYGRALSLILFDIDLFKEVNDKHGHLAGDAVLKGMAVLVSGHVRTEQVMARVGGEEFALLCPEVDAEGACALAERLREAIAEQPDGEAGNPFLITCSFGVAARVPGMVGPPISSLLPTPPSTARSSPAATG